MTFLLQLLDIQSWQKTQNCQQGLGVINEDKGPNIGAVLITKTESNFKSKINLVWLRG